MNRFSKVPSKAAKDAGKEELKQFERARVARHTKLPSFEDFSAMLYQCLWAQQDGYDNPAELVHDLHTRFGVDGIGYSWKHGYSCFEAMMRSPQLSEVVTIQRRQIREFYFEITYHANLNANKFADIRQKVPRKARDIVLTPQMHSSEVPAAEPTPQEAELIKAFMAAHIDSAGTLRPSHEVGESNGTPGTSREVGETTGTAGTSREVGESIATAGPSREEATIDEDEEEVEAKSIGSENEEEEGQ